MKIVLNDNWKMKKSCSQEVYTCHVPCSVYKTLISEKVIPNPYYRENEYISTRICDDDYDFFKSFEVSEDTLKSDRIYLRFDGIDTIADIFLNGEFLAYTNNMHRIWEFEVSDKLKTGENTLLVEIKSPNRYIKEMDEKRHLWGVEHCMEGYTHIRKAHCMFGWDWGPKLPDMGIWRDVSLNAFNGGRISDCYYTQIHENGLVRLSCKLNYEDFSGECIPELTVYSPDGEVCAAGNFSDNKYTVLIENPQLWWVNGFGGQPLYTCVVSLKKDGQTVDEKREKIGLRTLTISQEKDQWGEEFCFVINGRKIFAMGANYIPEDQIVTRCTEEKTRRLLDECKKANFNFIRVWGGGYYPDDYFYDWCDENGFIVWQDFMFACSAYLL
ncbi:MAG: glycoside hydrolase family 2 protein, partial [Hominimerdicola sp.]